MNIEIKLNEFPPDVREILIKRAIQKCVRIETVIAEFAVTTSKLIRKSSKPSA